MRVKDLKPEDVKIGLRLRSAAGHIVGIIVDIKDNVILNYWGEHGLVPQCKYTQCTCEILDAVYIISKPESFIIEE